MFKVLQVTKDTYITDKVINNVRCSTSNVGTAATLDLFKLYNEGNYVLSGSPIELSRLLVKFDLSELRKAIVNKELDITDASFNAQLQLFDVYGGQPTPENFTIDVFPLSQSFDEGRGRDVVKYADFDVTNFLTASYPNSVWIASGANDGGDASGAHDYLTSVNAVSLKASQFFTTGEENLSVDVTAAISATLSSQIPDEGFRISLSSDFENDARTYFVKRFAARNAYNEEKHPRLVVRFDDSVQDDTQILEFDSDCNVFLYNYRFNSLQNLMSASMPVTGTNCITLRLQTAVSGGMLEFGFTGSQHTRGSIPVDGIYYATINVPLTNQIASKLLLSGSVEFIPIWGSVDNTIGFVTGSMLSIRPPLRTNKRIEHSHYTVTTTGLRQSHKTNEMVFVRVNIFDYLSPYIKLTKEFLALPGLVIRDVHYQIRDISTDDNIIPFDTTYNSTRVSSDGDGMYFELDMSSLRDQRTYTIDIMISTQGNEYVYRNVSPAFRVNDLR
jgi:hypothetical protein